MLGSIYQDLSRRERQIMDVIYRFEEATAAEVMDNLPQAPGYSAVRTMLRILEGRGYLKHRQEGQRYVYSATIPRAEAQSSALKWVVATFFDSSVSDTVAALLNMSDETSKEEAEQLSRLIEKAKKERR